jgi:hypothetical protein
MICDSFKEQLYTYENSVQVADNVSYHHRCSARKAHTQGFLQHIVPTAATITSLRGAKKRRSNPEY